MLLVPWLALYSHPVTTMVSGCSQLQLRKHVVASAIDSAVNAGGRC